MTTTKTNGQAALFDDSAHLIRIFELSLLKSVRGKVIIVVTIDIACITQQCRQLIIIACLQWRNDRQCRKRSANQRRGSSCTHAALIAPNPLITCKAN